MNFSTCTFYFFIRPQFKLDIKDGKSIKVPDKVPTDKICHLLTRFCIKNNISLTELYINARTEKSSPDEHIESYLKVQCDEKGYELLNNYLSCALVNKYISFILSE